MSLNDQSVMIITTMIHLEWKYRCIMCRAEAHKINVSKPIFDALGIQLYAVVQEQIESEVCYYIC